MDHHQAHRGGALTAASALRGRAPAPAREREAEDPGIDPGRTDTVAAIATPAGRGGIGIVRVSGPHAPGVARQVLGSVPSARTALYRPFLASDGHVLDAGMALFFPAPSSYTGEDVLELHGHGGRVVLDMLLTRVVEAGARLAEPGEFTRRAFLNGKLDLAQAEAVADLIDSQTERAARSAQRSLQGEFSTRLRSIGAGLVSLRAWLEAGIDFPDEAVDELSDAHLTSELGKLRESVAAVLAGAERGVLLKEGLSVVIAGAPNVGKSTLMNSLCGRQAAIVTDIPGTTRDTLREHIQISGLPVHLIDTAGLREAQDAVEREGVARARAAIEEADAVLLLVDDEQAPVDEDPLDAIGSSEVVSRTLVVRNKIDLSGRPPGPVADAVPETVRVSARTGEGLASICAALEARAGLDGGGEDTPMARRRHLDALGRCLQGVGAARAALSEHGAAELAAEDMRVAQQALGEITGEVSSDDLLDTIFARFCIGK